MKILLSFLFLMGCASHGPSSAKPTDAEISLVKGESRVGTYVSSWHGFRTSSYWIEGPTGLILIDTQFLTSAAVEMVDWAEKVTGKKAVLAIVLHPNPDKFNGTAVFQKRGIKVVTSAQVLAAIPEVHELRKTWFFERFKPDYPAEQPKPESFGDKSTIIEAAGLKLTAHVMGAGCSDAHVVIEWERNVFVGDLATIGFHSWLELGMLEEWLKRLDEIKALDPKYVRTGRGGTGDSDTLDREETYLKRVIEVVGLYKPKKGVRPSEEVQDRIVERLVKDYPSYEYPLFIANGVSEAWEHLAK